MKTNLRAAIALSILGSSAFLIMSFGVTSKKGPDYSAYLDQMEYDDQNPQWENLKVLPQDITRDSLEFLMVKYANALSVSCDHCHSPQADNPRKLDFAADGKIEKEITRGMIKMTDEINANYFRPHFIDPKPDQVYVVDCVMCHRGVANPEIYLGKMHGMYKKYDRSKDHRKEQILEMIREQGED